MNMTYLDEPNRSNEDWSCGAADCALVMKIH